MKAIFYSLLFLCSFCYGNEEIVVHLNSSVVLHKTFVNVPDEALEKIMRYDIEHNGFCQIVEKKEEAEYIIEGNCKDQKVTFVVQKKRDGRSLQFEPIQLTGDLAKDRKKIHLAADLICKELFGVQGIASEHILYTSRKNLEKESSSWISELWLADYDGASAKQVTNENALCVTPCFIPKKVQGHCPYFFYVSYREGEPKIFLGGEGFAKRVTYMLGNQLMPAISPTLNRIAFISTVHGKEDLYIQNFSLEEGVMGKAIKLFSAPMATQGTPTFSPDGKKIAFVSNKDGTARIYIMTLPKEGEGPRSCKLQLISKKNRNNTEPNWSKDGKKLAYSAQTREVRQIWIYDIENDQEIQLTYGKEHKENPVWAANSLHLMYNSASYEKAELYMIDINQKRPTKIEVGPKDKRFPAWE